jgi:putative selenate reductase
LAILHHFTRENFEHDLQYGDAIAMLARLVNLAEKEGRGFRVKLTNTLGSVNDQGVLPGNEMYMSGRSLFPISTTVATLLSKEFAGKLPISYSGGATAFTVKQLFESGIRPITLATDMLKPGGYTRLTQMVKILEKSKAWDMVGIDLAKIEKLSTDARSGSFNEIEKGFRGDDTIKIDEKLPLFDCYVAPCQVACPIPQDVPEYVQLVGQGRYGEALALIYDKNALPAITGHICDHQCQLHCTRMDYEGAVKIRDMKRIAVENGSRLTSSCGKGPTDKDVDQGRCGRSRPTGLSAAYSSLVQFDTTVFEREESEVGGQACHSSFRRPVEALRAMSSSSGPLVQFHFGVDTRVMTVQALKDQGSHTSFSHRSEVDTIFLDRDRSRVRQSLSFLSACRKDPSQSSWKEVVVVGGGNTPWTRPCSTSIPGLKSFRLYRRTMPRCRRP